MPDKNNDEPEKLSHASDAFRYENECYLLVLQCDDDKDCRDCALANNSYLVNRYVANLERIQTEQESLEECDDDVGSHIYGPPDLSIINPIVDLMLQESPAKKWTVAAVKDYCFEHKHPFHYHTYLYNRIKRKDCSMTQ